MTGIARWLGFAALLALGIASAARSLSYGIWVDGEPGPGLFPLVASALVVIPSLISLLGLAVGSTGGAAPVNDVTATPRRFIAYSAVILIWPLLLQPLGYPLASGIALLSLLRAGGVGWILSAAVTVGAVGGSILLFQTLLEVPLPAGSWS
jgi:putative tricarboxylic transport membrane protein